MNASQNASSWRNTANVLPPEGKVVETMSPGGIQAPLIRSGKLWFMEDGSMYVYYSPVKWRELPASN